MRIILLAALLAGLAGSTSAQDVKDHGKVEGTLVVPKDVASFMGRVVEVRLYKYDPRIADKAADLVDKLEIKDFAHAQGQETAKAFTLGDKSTLDPKQSYYVTLFLLEGKTRTHIGECAHSKNNLCRVLTNGQPKTIQMTVRAVK